MSDHECVFVEEQEPSGRLILPPCIVCGCTAMDALDQLREWEQTCSDDLAKCRDRLAAALRAGSGDSEPTDHDVCECGHYRFIHDDRGCSAGRKSRAATARCRCKHFTPAGSGDSEPERGIAMMAKRFPSTTSSYGAVSPHDETLREALEDIRRFALTGGQVYTQGRLRILAIVDAALAARSGVTDGRPTKENA